MLDIAHARAQLWAQMKTAATPVSALDTLSRFGALFGFGSVAYVVTHRHRDALGDVPSPMAVDSSLAEPADDAWRQHYVRQRLFERDPVLAACEATTLTMTCRLRDNLVLLEADDQSQHVFPNPESQRCQRMTGILCGLIAPLHLPSGGMGYVAFGGSDPDRLNAHETIELREQLLNVAHRFHAVMRRLSASRGDSAAAGALSQRELNCLCWAARGKGIEEIAQIVGIAYGTVRFHLQNAERKLGTSSRSHAIALAAYRGYINPDHRAARTGLV